MINIIESKILDKKGRGRPYRMQIDKYCRIKRVGLSIGGSGCNFNLLSK